MEGRVVGRVDDPSTSHPQNHATAAHTYRRAHTEDKACKINQISRAAPADLKCTPHHPAVPFVGIGP